MHTSAKMTARTMLVVVVAALLLLVGVDQATAQISSFRCNDLCFSANDGVCDDGGPGSVTAACPWGSDCADCGTRPDYTRRPTPGLVPTDQPTTRSPSPPTVHVSTAPTPKVTLSPTDPAAQLTKKPTQMPTTKPSASPVDSLGQTQIPSKAPTTILSVCSKIRNKKTCCAPNLAMRRVCKYRGCRWIAKKRRCIPDTSNFNPAIIPRKARVLWLIVSSVVFV